MGCSLNAILSNGDFECSYDEDEEHEANYILLYSRTRHSKIQIVMIHIVSPVTTSSNYVASYVTTS